MCMKRKSRACYRLVDHVKSSGKSRQNPPLFLLLFWSHARNGRIVEKLQGLNHKNLVLLFSSTFATSWSYCNLHVRCQSSSNYVCTISASLWATNCKSARKNLFFFSCLKIPQVFAKVPVGMDPVFFVFLYCILGLVGFLFLSVLAAWFVSWCIRFKTMQERNAIENEMRSVLERDLQPEAQEKDLFANINEL